MFGIGTKGIAAIAGLLVLVGAVIAGVAVASGDSYDPVHAPQWQAGYTFSYDVVADIQATTDGLEEFELPAETDLTVGPIPVKKEILSTEYRDLDGQPVYISAATFPLSNLQAGSEAFGLMGGVPAFATAERQADLAPVPVLPDWSCRSDDCPSGGLDFIASNPLTYLNFPLTEGKRWEQEADLGIPVPLEELEGVDRVHVIGEVGAMETVDLGQLGSVDAVRVDISYTPVGLQDAIADLAAMMEDAGFEIERFNVQLGMHEIVHYSPDFESIVQQQYIVRALIDIALKGDFQGHEFDEAVYGEFDAVLSATLTGADRVAKAEMSPLEILNTLTDADLISDVRGSVSYGAPYSIGLQSDVLRLNAAEFDQAFVEASVYGADGLPEGHYIDWQVTDAAGDYVTEHKGDTLYIFGSSEPGVFTIEASAVDPEQGVVAESGIILVADYFLEEEVGCDWIGYCDELEIPVNPGVQDLFVYADAPSLFGWTGGLTLIDANGDRHSYDEAIQLSADDIEDMGYGTYTVYFQDPLMAFQQFEMEVFSSYGAPHEPVEEPQPAEPEGGDGQSLLVQLLMGIDQGLAGL